MTSKTALITGITGQDGSYLAELLLSKGYTVHGVIRRSSGSGLGRIAHLVGDERDEEGRMRLHHGDLSDGARLIALLDRVVPSEIYHLAAQSDVHVSFEQPEYTGAITALGTTRLLEALRITGLPARYYQASSSEMFGATPPLRPRGRPSSRVRRTRWPRRTATGWPVITGSPTPCTPSTESCSTTSHPGAARLS